MKPCPIARRAIDRLADADAVIVPSGSCAAMLKNFYPQLFAGFAESPAVNVIASKSYEFSEFLVHRLGVVDVGAKFPHRVTFHDGCHGLRELGMKREPRELLSHVQGLELVEMAEAETCCGFGGTFGVKFPMISTAMGEVKCASAMKTKADYIVSNDSSCLMQIQGLLDHQRNVRPRTIHLAEVLANQ